MNYKNKSISATFKNSEFDLLDPERLIEKQLSVHFLPGVEYPKVQNLKSKDKKIIITAIISGKNAKEKQRSFLIALESEAPGELFLPEIGTFFVECKSINIKQPSNKLGATFYTLEFILVTNTIQTIENNINSSVQLQLNSNSLLIINTSEYVKNFTSIKNPSLLTTINNTLINLLSNINSNSTFNGEQEYIRNLKNINSNLLFLVNSPSVFAKLLTENTAFSILKYIGEITDSIARNLFYELSMIFSASHEDDIKNIGIESNEKINKLIKLSCIASLSYVLPNIDFQSIEDSKKFKASLINKIDKVIYLNTLSPAEYQSILTITQSIELFISQVASSLKKINTTILNATTAAIVLSNDLYGTIAQENTILNMNGIIHPGFVPGGVELKILV